MTIDGFDIFAFITDPSYVWFNTTRMRVWTHLKISAQGHTGIGLYPDKMIEHDDMVGDVLKQLDDLGIADNREGISQGKRRRLPQHGNTLTE